MPVVDTPPLDKVTAWQRGQIAFDSTPLEAAIADMNRYNRVPIVLKSAEVAKSIHISGIFRAGDSMNFAQALSKTYRLQISVRPAEIVLSESRTDTIQSTDDSIRPP